jgi:hypothetical protein
MSQTPPTDLPQDVSAAPLGVMEAVRMGWRLLRSDFWRLWLVALVLTAILMGAQIVCQCFGIVPLVGGLISAGISLAVALFAQPALESGLFYAIRQKIDGAGARVENLFAAFRWRYWETVVAALPGFGLGFAALLVIAVAGLIGFLVIMGVTDGNPEGLFEDWDVATPYLVIGAGVLIVLAVVLAAAILALFLVFVLLAVWDFPQRFWAPIAASLRLVRGHFWSVLGLAMLFGLVYAATFLVSVLPAGGLAGAGALLEQNWDRGPPVTFLIFLAGGFLLFYPLWVFMLCAVAVWWHATIIYLYRAWSGQPLVQTVTFPWELPASATAPAVSPPPPAGPVPPNDVESPRDL